MKKRLLPILLLSSLFVIGGCANKGGTDKKDDEQGDTTQYGVAIANKDVLTAAWYTDSNQRSITVTLTPEANPVAEMASGALTVTSSNTTAVNVTGLAINPLAVGKSTITVSYHGVTDSVEVEVKDGDAKARYGTAHSGTAEDPFTNEDALLVAKSADYEQQTFYVKGEIASFYHTPGSRNDGAVSWFLKPAQENGEKFEIYKCYKKETAEVKGKDTYLTDDDVWKGGIATAYGTFTSYNGQYETSSAIFVSCEGTKPQPKQTITGKTIAEILEIGKALDDGDATWDLYVVEGYIAKKTGTNYFLADTENASADDEKALFELYNFSDDTYNERMTLGAKVRFTCSLKNYHGQVENAAPVENFEFLADGQEAAIPVEGATALASLEAGTYKAGLLQTTINENCFFKGTLNSSKYGETSSNWADAADVVIEGNETDGFKMKIGTKYLNAKVDGTKVILALEDDGVAYQWNTQAKTLQITLTVGTAAAEPYYIGTYSSFNTLSASKLSYLIKDGALVKGQFPLQFYAKADLVNTPTALQINQKVSTVVGAKVNLFLTANPYNFDRSNVVWETSDATKATVANGTVTAVAAGTATITAKVGDIKDTCEVTIKTVNSAVVENPVADTEYLAGISKENVAGTALFIDGTISSNKLNTTLDPTKGAKAKLIAVDGGGYKVTVGGKYLNAALSGTYANLALKNDAKDGSVFEMDANIKSLTIELSGTKYYIGTYANGTALKSTQLSLSKYSYIWKDNALVEGQYPLVMLTGSIAD